MNQFFRKLDPYYLYGVKKLARDFPVPLFSKKEADLERVSGLRCARGINLSVNLPINAEGPMCRDR